MKHGHSRRLAGGATKTYKAWASMMARCNISTASGYANYGGRGIRVCERWHEFQNFLADMGECGDGMSLDRLDVNGNYEQSNCRWATASEQARNTRRTRHIEFGGRTQCLSDWANEFGVTVSCLHNRLFRDALPIEIAFTKPFKKSGVKGVKRC